MSDIDQEIAELEAKMADRDKGAEAKRKAAAESRAKADRLQELRDREAIADLEEKHGAVGGSFAVVELTRADGSVRARVALRTPERVFVKRYGNSEMKMDDGALLYRGAILYPDKDIVEKYLDELPGAHGSLLTAVLRLAGAQSKESSGKS